MNTEQERAAFEAWAASIGFCVTGKYAETIDVLCAESAFKAGYRAGRAAAKAETVASEGRWYMLANDGMATLCASEADALAEAADADAAWPRKAPHRAVQLVPADQIAAAVDAERSEHRHAMAVLRQIADMPRRTREQRLASACVRFLDAIRAGEKEPSDA